MENPKPDVSLGFRRPYLCPWTTRRLMGKTFFWISRIRIIAQNWFLARLFCILIFLNFPDSGLSHIKKKNPARENIRFSSLFAAGDVSRGGTSATQRQKFHTDDANQCLHNKSGSHGVPNTNCPILRVLWSILVKCRVHLPTSSSKTQTLFLEKSIFH